ncbi:HU family DNA-binding protein [Xylanibacter ruminicola]|uniref:DNA-binding protein, histone-like, putative n=1 Tax=Xylanibacter ruminicola TaxID=839 RepID=A0A1M6W5S8_XYLRU|nr:HU family DNA-binding protein [Xylanibacter ruminicola]SHK89087.1 DNA-binding protein, histone-like, putative [Xylanibacter ruminicola]
MAVLYRLSQNKMKDSSAHGKWFAQAAMTGTVDTDALAEIMQRNCTVKKSDILAVISELIETMQDQLQNSKRVKLNGFGAFKIGIENAKGGAQTAAEFSASKNIKGLHVLFQPEVKTDSTGQRRKAFISGCTVQEAPKNNVDTTKPAEDAEDDGPTGGYTPNPGD